jgi:hypothetical protein
MNDLPGSTAAGASTALAAGVALVDDGLDCQLRGERRWSKGSKEGGDGKKEDLRQWWKTLLIQVDLVRCGSRDDTLADE